MHVVNGVAAAVSYFLFSLTRLNSLKTRTLNVKWCIRTVFKTMFLKFELLIIFLKQGPEMVHSGAL